MEKLGNMDKKYETYLKRYERLQNETDTPLKERFSREEFEVTYTAMYNDRMREVRRGERKVLNVSRDILQKSMDYKYSYQQTRAIKKALENEYGLTGEKFKQIRKGESEFDDIFWDVIEKEREFLKQQGLSKDEIKTKIGQTFFGSK